MRCASFATVVVSISSSVGMTIPNCFSKPICSSTSISESMPRSSSDLSAVSFAGAIPTIPATCLISSCSAMEIASSCGSPARCARNSSKFPPAPSPAAPFKNSRTKANFGALATPGKTASRDQLISAKATCDVSERIACSNRSSARAGASVFTPSRSPSIRATTALRARCPTSPIAPQATASAGQAEPTPIVGQSFQIQIRSDVVRLSLVAE